MARKTSRSNARSTPRYSESSVLGRVSINPSVCGGRPCIRDTRVRVIDVLELLASGMTPRQIVKQLPYLQPEDVSASLVYAAQNMDHARLVA